MVPGKYIPGSDGTFAQNYQDVWFEALATYNGWVGGESTGFYIELGAFEPLECSNTALMNLKHGWSGIVVEPRKKDFSVRHNTAVRGGRKRRKKNETDGQILLFFKQRGEG